MADVGREQSALQLLQGLRPTDRAVYRERSDWFGSGR